MTGGTRAAPPHRGRFAGIAFAAAVGIAAVGCAEARATADHRAASNGDDAGTEGAPRFVSPAGAGIVFDASRERCLAIPVEVSDPDSQTVTVVLQPPSPEGATLTSEGTRRHRLVWCPSDEAAGERLVRFVLAASDGEHPAVEKPYVVLVHR
jgi:hypothetical protein